VIEGDVLPDSGFSQERMYREVAVTTVQLEKQPWQSKATLLESVLNRRVLLQELLDTWVGPECVPEGVNPYWLCIS
jgi:hypothetical protein